MFANSDELGVGTKSANHKLAKRAGKTNALFIYGILIVRAATAF
jgi:hypothetical protein